MTAKMNMDPQQPRDEPEFGQLVRKAGDWLTRTPWVLNAALLLILVGFLWRSWNLSLLGFVLLALALALLQRRFLRKEQVLDSWLVLIRGGQCRGEPVLRDTQELFAESKAPDIKMERQSLAPGIIRGMAGDTRDFLAVANNTNGNLKTYEMYISARDYGNNLQVSWYLVTRLGFWRTLVTRLLFLIVREPQPETIVAKLDLFDLQDLTAYVTNAHHCLLEAVEKLLIDLQQDPSKIERKSRGFLGIS